jgi:hypothetical protein
MKFASRVVCALAACLSLSSTHVAANPDPAWYIGASASRAELDYFLPDNRDSGWSLYGGREIGRYGLIEARYSDLGRFGYRSIPALGGSTFADLGSTGLAGGVRVPFAGERFGIDALVGVQRWRADYVLDRSGVTSGFQPSASGTDPWYEVRLRWAITERFSLTVSHTWLTLDDDSIDGRLKVLGGGLLFRF